MRIIRKKSKDYPKPLTGQPKRLKVGFPVGEVDSDVISRAVWTHYGTRGGASGGGWGGPVPARPFLTNAMRDNRLKYRAGLRSSAAGVLLGRVTMKTTFDKLGAMAQGDVQASITSLSTPPNSATTIAMKGSSNPLIDTGEMRQAVTWKVE